MNTSLVSLAVVIALAIASVAQSQSLKDRMQNGLSQMKKGAEQVGQGAADVAGSVAGSIEESVDSTVDLLTDEATVEETRAELDEMAAATLDRLFQEQPAAQDLYAQSVGHAVFDTRKLSVAGLAGGTGRGVAISAEGTHTYMRMGTAGVSLSFGIGGFETQVVLMFETEAAFTEFVTLGLDATADAGSMFGEDSASIGVQFVNGRAMFVLTKQGWKVSATAAGTKYWVDAALN